MEANPLGATEEEAAVGILALMEEGDKNPPPPVPETLKKSQEEPAEETEESEEATAEEAQPEKEAEAVEIDLDEPLWEVKVQGETKKISTNEALKSYMMETDYRQKTAELARQREEVQEKLRQGVESERKQYMEALQMQQKLLWQAVAPELQKIDLDKLADTLKAKIPNWGQEVQTSLVKTGMDRYGFSREELAGLYDPRMIEVLHDAHQYHLAKQQTEKAKEVAQKKVIAKPKVLKPGSKQPAQTGDDLKQLKKTGKLEDAAQAIFNRL
jgi:hypothetical protein